MQKIRSSEVVRMCLRDVARGDLASTHGLIDWLTVDKKVPLNRIINIAIKHFHINDLIVVDALSRIDSRFDVLN